MTEGLRYIIGATPGEVIDWDTDPRVRASPPQPLAFEYGARDPDDPSRMHVHRSFEMAQDAAEWWRIDGKVYRRQVTDWEVVDD